MRGGEIIMPKTYKMKQVVPDLYVITEGPKQGTLVWIEEDTPIKQDWGEDAQRQWWEGVS